LSLHHALHSQAADRDGGSRQSGVAQAAVAASDAHPSSKQAVIRSKGRQIALQVEESSSVYLAQPQI